MYIKSFPDRLLEPFCPAGLFTALLLPFCLCVCPSVSVSACLSQSLCLCVFLFLCVSVPLSPCHSLSVYCFLNEMDIFELYLKVFICFANFTSTFISHCDSPIPILTDCLHFTPEL